MKTEHLALEHVTPGMLLGGDVIDANGAVLLAAGSALSESLLAALGRRGIRQVEVTRVEQLSESEREARREAVRARLAHLFRGAGETEAGRFLFEVVLDYRMEQLG
ncbi:MAG: hypothetical protein Q8M09_16015 [Pseudomonadota bacterium]|nr:hypothetical protein [Pseudomonadota bacterium]MDP1905727.1 hypothetical protein [Pseudomonadota bacterium]MDP2353599.1 hypothetical protein [Pseudomonadota bacterium]